MFFDYLYGCILYFLYFTVPLKGLQHPEIEEPDRDLIQPSTYINYMYFEDKKTWNEARTVCQSLNGDLAKVDSPTLRDYIADIAWENYLTDIFTQDYWLGLVEPTANDHIWVSDCSSLNFVTNYASVWKDTELCFHLKKDEHRGERMKCDTDQGFLCQIQTDEPCSFIPRLDSEVLSVTPNISSCQGQCSDSLDCWAAIEMSPDTCIMLAPTNYGSETLKITTKFCLNVTRNETSVNPAPNSNTIPDHACSATGSSTISPTLSSTMVPSSSAVTVSSSSDFCPQMTTTETSTIISYSTDVVSAPCNITETINVTQSVFNTEYINITQTVTNTEFLNVTQTIYSTTPAIFFSETVNISTVFITITQTVASSAPNNYTTEEAQHIADELVKNLTIDSKTTGAHSRKLNSANDTRASSMYMGFVGIVSVVVPLMILILPDLKRILMHIQTHQAIYTRRNS